MAGVAARSQSTKTESEKWIIQPSNLRATGWTLCTCKRWSTSAQQDDRGLIDWSSQTVGFPDPGGCIIIQVWLCEIRAYALLLFLENEKHQNSPLQHKPRLFVCVRQRVLGFFVCLLPPSTLVEVSGACVCVLHACVHTDGGLGCTPLLSWLLCRRTPSVIGWSGLGKRGKIGRRLRWPRLVPVKS